MEEVRGILEELLVLRIAHHEVDLVVRGVRRLGAEPRRAAVAHLELVVGEKARVLEEETELARARRGDVPLARRHEEHGPPRADEVLALAGHRQRQKLVRRLRLVHLASGQRPAARASWTPLGASGRTSRRAAIALA